MSRSPGIVSALGLAVGLALSLFGSPPAEAEVCTLDPVPAATVLVPYFEVDLADAQGVTTFVHLHNAAPEATLAKITFWTDWSIPSLEFDVFLTGYDIVRLDLRDAFDNGNIPITADEQSDPMDTISPHGANPEWDGSFTFCQNIFPFLVNPVIIGGNVERLVDGHTGQPVTVGGEELCFGENHGDQIARGYLTIDDVQRCALVFPSDGGYFGGDDPVASNDNQLWSEVWLTWPNEDRRSAIPAVHLEAVDGTGVEPGTFYQRFSAGADLRERLPTRWGAQSFANAAVTDDWIVWRDSGSTETQGYNCAFGGPQQLSMNGANCFDEQETLTAVCEDDTCLPFDTQKIEASLLAPDSGWCDLDLSSVGIPGRDSSQAWVGVQRRRSAVGDAGVSEATVLGGQCAVSNVIFEDGFESGDTSLWTATVGGAP